MPRLTRRLTLNDITTVGIFHTLRHFERLSMEKNAMILFDGRYTSYVDIKSQEHVDVLFRQSFQVKGVMAVDEKGAELNLKWRFIQKAKPPFEERYKFGILELEQGDFLKLTSFIDGLSFWSDDDFKISELYIFVLDAKSMDWDELSDDIKRKMLEETGSDTVSSSVRWEDLPVIEQIKLWKKYKLKH